MKTSAITCIAALAACLGILPAHGAVIFEGTTWYSSGASANLTVASGTMSNTTLSPNGSFAITYLTPSGTPLTLTTGQTLTFTVDFSISGAAASASGLRFGLFNSGGSRINTDNGGLSNAAYANYIGYASAFGSNNVSGNSLTSALWDRTSSNNALISTSSVFTSNASASTNTSSTPPLTSGTPYTMTLTLTLNSPSSLTVASTLTGSTLPGGGITRSYVDTTPVINFDTVALYSTSSMSSGLNFTNVSVSIVPEPTSSSFLIGAIGLLFVSKGRCLLTTSRTRR